MTGIGFIGAGSIIKLCEEHLIHGLTASAWVWTSAAVGIASALGQVGIALITAILAILVLAVVAGLERRSQSGRG